MNAPNPSKACQAGRHINCTRRSCSCECHDATQRLRDTQQQEHDLAVELAEQDRTLELTAAERAFRKAADRHTRAERIVLLAERIADLARELNQ